MASSWEDPRWGTGDMPTVGFDLESCDIDYDNILETEAASELFDFIVRLKQMSVLSAKQACILSFWASKAGATGMVKKLSFKPSAQSGHFSRHFDSIVGSRPSDQDFYRLPVPLHSRLDATRNIDSFPVVPPHEAFANEILTNPGATVELARAIEADELPETYKNHPVVRSASPGTSVFPLAMYLDGVLYTRRDTIIGFFVYSILTNVRHLVCTIRKSEICQCGCKGWCSLFPLLTMLSWSFSSMCRGTYPTARHDNSAWTDRDDGRASLGGCEYGWLAILLFLKGDWAEYSGSLGFPSHASHTSPCPFCFTDAASLWDLIGFSHLDMPKTSKTLLHYKAACDVCEILAHVRTHAQLRTITASLFFDKRLHGQRGRCLSRDLPQFMLSKGDRLEPSKSVMDVAAIDALTPPLDLVFWRSANETLTKHRNPIFDDAMATNPAETLGIDWLHAISLGVLQFYVMHLLHELLRGNAFGISGTAAVNFEMGVRRLKSELWAWYSSEEKAGRKHNRLNSLVSSMLGSYNDQCFKVHGAEANGFFFFRLCFWNALVPYWAMLAQSSCELPKHFARCST